MSDFTLPDTIDFDPEDLTLGEMEDIEEKAGVSFQQIVAQFEAQDMQTSTLRAVMWVLIRRLNPEYTFEDTRDLNVRDMSKLRVADDDSDTPLDEAVSGATG